LNPIVLLFLWRTRVAPTLHNWLFADRIYSHQIAVRRTADERHAYVGDPAFEMSAQGGHELK
jgi:hypothetical protein